MRDLVQCEGAPHKWIDRKDLHSPTRLEFQCHCGVTVGWPDCVDHVCPWTATDPDERACLECERFRGCTCDGGPVHD